MLAPFQEQLQRLRGDRSAWQLAAFKAFDEGHEDPSSPLRYGLLLSLHYDRTAADYDLIRFLFEQEVISAEESPMAGCGMALLLGAHLLSQHKQTGDLPLFARAKSANFDTLCGFPSLCIFSAGIEEALATIELLGSDSLAAQLIKEITVPTQEELTQWRQQQAEEYPLNPHELPTLTRVQQAFVLGDTATASTLIREYEEAHPEEYDELLYWYGAADKHEDVLRILRGRLAEERVGRWQYLYYLVCYPAAAVKAGRLDEAWETLKKLESDFLPCFRGQKPMELTRAALEAALLLAEVSPPQDPLARRAFRLAYRWLQCGFAYSLRILERASLLAEAMGETGKARVLVQRRDKERRRCERMHDGAKKVPVTPKSRRNR